MRKFDKNILESDTDYKTNNDYEYTDIHMTKFSFVKSITNYHKRKNI